MDGLARLEKVFREEFSSAKTQRCQVHVAKNVLTKVTQTHKKRVADDLRSIFYLCRRAVGTAKRSSRMFFTPRWIIMGIP